MPIVYGGSPGGSTRGITYPGVQPQPQPSQTIWPFKGIVEAAPKLAGTGGVTLPYTQDYTTGTPSIPAELSYSRPGVASQFNSSGVLQTSIAANTARFDYRGGTLQGLLVEEQRTNYVLGGSDNAAGFGGISISVPSSTTGIDGTTSLNDYTDDASTASQHFAYTTVNKDSGQHYGCWSVYAKPKASARRLALFVGLSGNGVRAIFDLVGGQVGVAAAATGTGWTAGQSSIEALTGTYAGWYRCQVTCLTGTETPTHQCWIQLDAGTGTGAENTTYNGDSTSGLTAGFAQWEYVNGLTDKASSYISTQAAGAAVTRPADILTSADPGLLSATAWAVEVGRLQDADAATLLGLDNTPALSVDTSGFLTTGQGAAQTTGNSATWTGTNNNRGGVAWDTTPRVSISLDGGTVVTAANNPSTLTPTTITLGSGGGGGGGYINGYLRSFGAYASLTDSQLASVTTAGGSYTPASGSVGSSTGSNAAAAVGAWLQSGVGSSAGANTTAGVGAELQSGVGSSAGTNTTTGIGHWLQSGIGSSAGVNTATATGSWLQSGIGSSAGTNTTTATATWLQAGVGSAAGANTASATGAKLQAGVGSAAGANTATGVGAELQSGVGSSAGSNTVTGVGAELQSGVGSSAGTDTVTGTGHWLQSGVGNAQGDNTSSGYSPGVSNVGSSSGTNTATAVGNWLQAGVGSSAGDNTATGVGSTGGVVTGAGSSVGDNIATAIGAWLQVATGTAIGENVASAAAGGLAGLEADFSNDFAQDFSGYPGAEAGLGTGDFNNDFNNDFAVFHVGRIVSGTGTSVGGNIATAVSSTVVFIPPVYPPPPPIPVKVWHPAQEYHRVQAPRATRIYKHGTELRRRPPLGMKRRYG